jgi:uncharacterized RDD family membrane protein YckC
VITSAQPRQAAAAGTPFAGFWIRLVAFLIDSLAIGAIVSVLSFPRAGLVTWDAPVRLDPWVTTLETVVGLLYFTLLWSSLGTGRTLGMRMVGLRVVGLDGQSIGLGAAVVRWVGLVISGAAVLIGLVWVAFDPRKQGWHDKLAGTLVVRDDTGSVAPEPAMAGPRDTARGAEHPFVRAVAVGLGLLGVGLAVIGIALSLKGDEVVDPDVALLAVGLLAAVSLIGVAMAWREPGIGAAAFLAAALGIALALGPRLGPWYDRLLAATAAGPAAEIAYWSAAPSMAVLLLAGVTLGIAGLLALAGTGRSSDARA